MNSAKIHLEVAITRENLQLALSIADKQGRAVFGTLDGRVLKQIRPTGADIPVFFYEPG